VLSAGLSTNQFYQFVGLSAVHNNNSWRHFVDYSNRILLSWTYGRRTNAKTVRSKIFSGKTDGESGLCRKNIIIILITNSVTNRKSQARSNETVSWYTLIIFISSSDKRSLFKTRHPTLRPCLQSIALSFKSEPPQKAFTHFLPMHFPLIYIYTVVCR